jgi:uncharacterized Zn-binding protein involved in type VI secretion
MPGVVRQGDKNTTGGAVISGVESSVLINGRAAAVIGSVIEAHAPWGPPHPPHAAATITTGVATVLVNGKPIAFVGSNNSCGHVMIEGSGNVNV